MSQRPVKRRATVIDPMFWVPEGVDELVYDDEAFYNANNFVITDEGEEVVVDITYDDESSQSGESDDVDYSDAPETPSILGIIPPQVIRMDDSGKEVVDVVLEVDDIYGVTKYELRVTKI